MDEATGDRKENVKSGKDVGGAVHKEVDGDAIVGQKGQTRLSSCG